jgi:hypothetical protein
MHALPRRRARGPVAPHAAPCRGADAVARGTERSPVVGGGVDVRQRDRAAVGARLTAGVPRGGGHHEVEDARNPRQGPDRDVASRAAAPRQCEQERDGEGGLQVCGRPAGRLSRAERPPGRTAESRGGRAAAGGRSREVLAGRDRGRPGERAPAAGRRAVPAKPSTTIGASALPTWCGGRRLDAPLPAGRRVGGGEGDRGPAPRCNRHLGSSAGW